MRQTYIKMQESQKLYSVKSVQTCSPNEFFATIYSGTQPARASAPHKYDPSSRLRKGRDARHLMLPSSAPQPATYYVYSNTSFVSDLADPAPVPIDPTLPEEVKKKDRELRTRENHGPPLLLLASRGATIFTGNGGDHLAKHHHRVAVKESNP